MTRIRRLSRLSKGCVALAAAVVATFVALPAAGVDARPRTESAVLADEAARSLEALDRWTTEHNPADYVRYLRGREATAALTAEDLELDAEALGAAWAAAPIEKQAALLAALSQLGVPYERYESDPAIGFDCSGLTSWAYERAGVELPRSSYYQIRAADRIEQEDAEPGDLLYYPGHIGMYLGEGSMIHSPNSGNNVEAIQISTKRSFRYGDPITED